MAESRLRVAGLTVKDIIDVEKYKLIGWQRLAGEVYDRLEELVNVWFDDEEIVKANDLLGILEEGE